MSNCGYTKGKTSKTKGQNHYGGVAVNFYVKDTVQTDTITLSFLDQNKKLIKEFTNHPNKEKKEEKLELKLGDNQFNWNLMYPDAEKVKGMILWWASLSGPKALPGTYTVKLTKNGIVKPQDFTILKDPRSKASMEDMQAQFEFILEIRDKLTEIHKALKNITKVKTQIKQLKKSIADTKQHKELLAFADTISKKVTSIENNLYQTKSKSNQDPLNFPIKLNNKLGHLNALTSIGNYRPTDQTIAFKNEIIQHIDKELADLNTIFKTDVKALNQKVKESSIDLIQLD